MGDQKRSAESNILEAVNHLSSMAELNIEELALEREEGATDRGQQSKATLSRRWLDLGSKEHTVKNVKDTLRVVHRYLKHIYAKDSKQLEDLDFQKGVRSIIELANEAVDKVDQCSLILGQGQRLQNLYETKEYRDLQSFYQKKILAKFEKVLEEEEAWQEEWVNKESQVVDIERRGLKDLETVTRDRDYELFYMQKDDGSHFYNPNLARHIRLVANFDQIITSLDGTDPLVRIKLIQDREEYELAKKVQTECKKEINAWCVQARKQPNLPIVQKIYLTLLGLFMGSKPRNLLQHTSGKCCLSYFRDFCHYLRGALQEPSYFEWMNNPPDMSDALAKTSLELLHAICFALYTHEPNHYKAVNFLYQIIESSGFDRTSIHGDPNYLTIWNRILESQELLSLQLKNHPSGPLFKTLDLLSEKDDRRSFDPIMQENIPAVYYKAKLFGKEVQCIRMPSPTRQRRIGSVHIAPEFKGMLRYLAGRSGQRRFLVCNLQDRTSWKEYHRCKVLEEYQTEDDIRWTLWLMSLSKDSNFYNQSDDYLKISDPEEFFDVLLEQITSDKECGFYIYNAMDSSELTEFLKGAIRWTHTHFFGAKKSLSRKNRLDFIEIVYHLLILRAVQLEKIEFIGFMCKDGIDAGGVTLASFYAFIKLLSKQNSWKDDQMDLLLSMTFLPALLIRERCVDERRLQRMVSMLSVLSAELEVHREKILADLDSLFKEKKFTEAIELY